MPDDATIAAGSTRPAPSTFQLDAALDLARRGFHVFPITAGAKFPPLVRWKKEATTDALKIRRWWAKWPTANVGVATGPSRLVVVDVDVRDGKPGPASLSFLEVLYDPMPPTLTARTASGGRHMLYRGSARCSAGRIGEAIDVKSAGGYIVAPGSSLDNGGEYRWENPGAEIADAPAWLIEAAAPKRREYAHAEPGDVSPEMLARILSQIPAEDYRAHDDWLAIMMACHHATNGLGREEFIEWCHSDPPYHGDDRIGPRWDSLQTDHPNPVTKAYLFKELYRRGGHEHWAPPEEDFEPIEVDALFRIPSEQTKTGAQRFRWLTLDEYEAMGPPEWLIQGVLPRWSVGMFYGPSGSGKSFLALEAAICVATGHDFHGREAKRAGGAFYVAAEDPRGFPIRERAWRQHHGVDERPAVRFLEGSLTLDQPGAAEALAASILEVDPEPGIVVIDTLSTTFAGNENTDDVKRYIMGCIKVRDLTQATTLFIHHTGKEESKSHIGSQHLRNDVDFVLRMNGEPKAERSELTADKFKGAATAGVLMRLVKKVVTVDPGAEYPDSLVLVEDAEDDFGDGAPDEVIGIVAAFEDGAKVTDIAARLADQLGLGRTSARNRIRDAFGVRRGVRGDTGRAVAAGERSLRLERSDPRNPNSGLVLRVSYAGSALR